ncbi:MAG: phospho-N-acetylmuramoyl-pentapeptide-transferase, partial [Clostridia bacterium]|nr:phospho-N-acetylmuramoyl-pentapeptide-transferase [Clostridia bacterium]
ITLCVFGIPLLLKNGDTRLLKSFIMMLLYGAIGFVDDFVKFFKKQNKGLTAIQKLIFQFAVAAGYLYSMKDSLKTAIDLPFTDKNLELGPFYWVFAIIFIVLVVNSVNLTDGIDGLAGGTTLVVSVFFGVVSYLLGEMEITLLCSALCGGMVGFLIYNIYPARIFMGDTGSLFLGGAVSAIAFWLNSPLLILLVGFVYLFEALSVVLQVFSFKTTGKRIFRMAPFHHHLEMCGWREPGIVSFSCVLTAILSIASYIIFYLI